MSSLLNRGRPPHYDPAMLFGLILAQLLAAPREVPPLDLRWSVAAEARACPSERWFRDELASHLGRDPFSSDAGSSRGAVHVRVTGGANVVAEVLLAVSSTDVPRSVARGEGPPRRCRELLAHAIEALEDVLLPREIPARAPAASPADERLVVTAAPPAAQAGPPSERRSDPGDVAASWRGQVALVIGAGFAGVPAPVSPTIAASLSVGRGVVDGVVGVTIEPLAGGGGAVPSSAGNLEVEMERVGAELGACFARPHLRLCGLGVARWIWARSPGLGSSGTQTGYQLGGALRVEARLPVGSGVELLGRVDTTLTGPKEFYFAGCAGGACANWRVGMFSVVLAVGAAVRGW